MSAQATNQTSLFGGSSFGTGFGTGTAQAGQQAVGTTVKFVAPTGQDQVTKNWSTQSMNTSHQCLTAMKEYELKSLEELRFEDYQANRKVPQQTSQFGSAGLFSSTPATTTGTGFGAGGLFGSNTQQTANRPLLFGSSTTTTTTAPATTSLFGQSTQATTANRTFGFGTATTTAPATGFSGFGATTTTPVFKIH